jgi:light-regulated signal transduction histidine kinase (bacteriophytochrome)
MDHLAGALRESDAEVARGPLPTVRGDGTQLVQLFQNLIGNAIKFRGERRPRVRVEAAQDESLWRFRLQDNGIGIDARYHNRLFDIFQRLHGREEYPGTGIGLAICKRIVERHGGRIWLESEPGHGTSFFFSLPTSEDRRHGHRLAWPRGRNLARGGQRGRRGTGARGIG